MIKLKSLLNENNRITMRNYDSEIGKLESEWDRLDSMGNQRDKQSEIEKKLSKLRNLKSKWEKMYGAVMKEVDAPPAIHQDAQSISSDFINYIKTVEVGSTGSLNPKYLKIYLVNGIPHIGYGHKLKPKESAHFKRGITQGYAEKLLKHDLEDAKKKAQEDVKSMFHVNIPLDQRQSEMLTDFVFNLGTLTSFPSFTKAVLNKDWKAVEKEYKRKYKNQAGQMVDIQGRNNAFHDRFLK